LSFSFFSLSLTEGKTGIGATLFILSGLSWALEYTGQPQLLTRMMAIRNDQDVMKTKWIATFWTLLAYLGTILTGLLGIAFVQSGYLGAESEKLSGDAEKILPVMVITLVNPILAGFLLSGVISAIMSTASTEMTVSSASISEDIIARLRRTFLENRRMIWLNKLLTLTIGTWAIVLELTMQDTVYGLVSYAWSGIGSSFGLALLLILFWKGMSRSRVYASLVCGTAGTIIWKNFFEAETDISERLTSFVFAFTMAVVVSLMVPERER